MVRKVKTSEVNIEDVSYDAVVETINNEEKTEEPPVEQKEEPEIIPDMSFLLLCKKDETRHDEVKPKKDVAKGVCEGCGKEMTLKNLKYAHKFVCSGLNKVEESLPVPEKPVLQRSETLQPEFKDEIEKPKPKAKAKSKTNKIVIEETPEVVEVPEVKKTIRKPRTKKPSEVAAPSEPVVMKKSRAVLKAEKYTELFEKAI